MSWIQRPASAVDCPNCQGHGCFLKRENEMYSDGSYRWSEWDDCEKCNGRGWTL